MFAAAHKLREKEALEHNEYRENNVLDLISDDDELLGSVKQQANKQAFNTTQSTFTAFKQPANNNEKPSLFAAASSFKSPKSQPLASDNESERYSEDEFANDELLGKRSPLVSTTVRNASRSGSSHALRDHSPLSLSPARVGRSRSSSRPRSASRSPSTTPRLKAMARGRQRAPQQHARDASSVSRSRSRTQSYSRSRSSSYSRSRSRSQSRSRDVSARGPAPSKWKLLLNKPRAAPSRANNNNSNNNKSFMDSLKSRDPAAKKRRQSDLKKMVAASFMASSKTTDYSKQISGLLSDLKECTFKPKISYYDKGGDNSVFSDRLKGYMAARKANERRQHVLDKTVFTFSPQLNHDKIESAEERKEMQKEFFERTQADIKRRNSELKAKLKEHFSDFQPHLNHHRNDRIKKPFLHRLEEDLDKRNNNIEIKKAAEKIEAPTFKPNLSDTAKKLPAAGSFLQRTIQDIESRNKKWRYRAKLLDLHEPAMGVITVPDKNEDPFYQNAIKHRSSSSHRQSLQEKARYFDGLNEKPKPKVKYVNPVNPNSAHRLRPQSAHPSRRPAAAPARPMTASASVPRIKHIVKAVNKGRARSRSRSRSNSRSGSRSRSRSTSLTRSSARSRSRSTSPTNTHSTFTSTAPSHSSQASNHSRMSRSSSQLSTSTMTASSVLPDTKSKSRRRDSRKQSRSRSNSRSQSRGSSPTHSHDGASSRDTSLTRDERSSRRDKKERRDRR